MDAQRPLETQRRFSAGTLASGAGGFGHPSQQVNRLAVVRFFVAPPLFSATISKNRVADTL